MARWLLGCTKAYWQPWQGEAALMHGPSTTPVDPLLLEWVAEAFHFVFWGGRNLNLYLNNAAEM
jgi:hypothetical protein